MRPDQVQPLQNPNDNRSQRPNMGRIQVRSLQRMHVNRSQPRRVLGGSEHCRLEGEELMGSQVGRVRVHQAGFGKHMWYL